MSRYKSSQFLLIPDRLTADRGFFSGDRLRMSTLEQLSFELPVREHLPPSALPFLVFSLHFLVFSRPFGHQHCLSLCSHCLAAINTAFPCIATAFQRLKSTALRSQQAAAAAEEDERPVELDLSSLGEGGSADILR